jgi:hypothetical protein
MLNETKRSALPLAAGAQVQLDMWRWRPTTRRCAWSTRGDANASRYGSL